MIFNTFSEVTVLRARRASASGLSPLRLDVLSTAAPVDFCKMMDHSFKSVGPAGRGDVTRPRLLRSEDVVTSSRRVQTDDETLATRQTSGISPTDCLKLLH